MSKSILTQAKIKELLHYDQDTGEFTWIVKRSGARKCRQAGNISNRGYRMIGINGTLYSAARLAFLYMTGDFPDNQVDHVSHVREDNRWSNLREATQQENSHNLPKFTTNTSGYTGVSWHKRINRWISRIRVDGNDIHLGNFTKLHDAIEARKQANVKYEFHPNHGK